MDRVFAVKMPYLCTVKIKKIKKNGKDRIRNLGLGRRSIWRRRSIRQYLTDEPELAPYKEMILHKNAELLFGK